MKPWMTGPKELLEHATEHVKAGSPFDHRIALISIDNAVELAMKTYLGLPERVRKNEGPGRKKLQEAGTSFPGLLDLLERYGADKLEGIELGDIEWYHRVRNTLYHEGNGITVDPVQVDGYLQIARILFENLFGEKIVADESATPTSALGELLLRWRQIEHNTKILYHKHYPEESGKDVPLSEELKQLGEKGVLDTATIVFLDDARKIRNTALHGVYKENSERLQETANKLMDLVIKLGDLCSG